RFPLSQVVAEVPVPRAFVLDIRQVGERAEEQELIGQLDFFAQSQPKALPAIVVFGIEPNKGSADGRTGDDVAGADLLNAVANSVLVLEPGISGENIQRVIGLQQFRLPTKYSEINIRRQIVARTAQFRLRQRHVLVVHRAAVEMAGPRKE